MQAAVKLAELSRSNPFPTAHCRQVVKLMAEENQESGRIQQQGEVVFAAGEQVEEKEEMRGYGDRQCLYFLASTATLSMKPLNTFSALPNCPPGPNPAILFGSLTAFRSP